MENDKETQEESQKLLLQENSKPPKTRTQKAIRKTFKGTAHLSNLLPTMTLLMFQILSPVVTKQGKCSTKTSKVMTLSLLGLCCLSCFSVRFTDSFKDKNNKVRYGIATIQGLWVIDGSVTLEPKEASKYKLRFIDFFHAFLSILVFAAVAMFDKNIVNCLFPTLSEAAKDLLAALPIVIGVICSVLFWVFPTKHHGIGFPLTRDDKEKSEKTPDNVK